MTKVAYWAGSAAVGAGLAILFWILFANSSGANHTAYMIAAIVCTALGVAFAIVAGVVAQNA